MSFLSGSDNVSFVHSATVAVNLVAGGGAGGDGESDLNAADNAGAGGGGAGGVGQGTISFNANTPYTFTVGQGGSSTLNSISTNGQNSSIIGPNLFGM